MSKSHMWGHTDAQSIQLLGLVTRKGKASPGRGLTDICGGGRSGRPHPRPGVGPRQQAAHPRIQAAEIR